MYPGKENSYPICNFCSRVLFSILKIYFTSTNIYVTNIKYIKKHLKFIF